MATRVLAVDWSGSSRTAGQRKGIWLAEASAAGLVRVDGGGWTRDAVVDHLLEEARRDPDLVVGLDFAFALPGWYLRGKRLDARGLWRRLAAETLTARMRRQGLGGWLRDPEPPFWRTAGGADGLPRERQYRRTELDLLAQGLQPKSVFKLVGAGQVGAASLYGMQALDRLADGGFHVWPFDGGGRPALVEIYPRALAPHVRRRRPEELRGYLAKAGVPGRLARRAADNEHAFDAAASALVMAAHVDELRALAAAPGYEREGKIWLPAPLRAASGEKPRGASRRSARRRQLVLDPALAPPPDYAHAAVATGGRLVHTAGAVPLDPKGRLVGRGDVAAQTRQTLANLTSALAAAGARPDDVVKTTVYVVARKGGELVAAWDVVRASEYAGVPSTLLGVALLGYTGQLVEIEAVAVLD